MSTDAEVGIGFFVGSLSTLRPLFWRFSRSNVTTDKEEEEAAMHDELNGARQASVVAMEMEGFSPVSKEIEEGFAINRTSIGKAI